MPKVVVTEAELKQIIKTVLAEQDGTESGTQIDSTNPEQVYMDEFKTPTANSKIKLIGKLTNKTNISEWVQRLNGITYRDISSFINTSGLPSARPISPNDPATAVQEFLDACIFLLLQNQSVTNIPVKGVKSISQAGRDLKPTRKIFSIDVSNKHYSDNERVLNAMDATGATAATIINFFNDFIRTENPALASICEGLELIPETTDQLFYADQAAEQRAKTWVSNALAASNARLKPIMEKYNTPSYKNFLYQPLRSPQVWRTDGNPRSVNFTPWRMTWTASNLFVKGLKEDGIIGLLAMHKSLDQYSGQDYRTVYQAGSAESLNESINSTGQSKILLTRSELNRVIEISLQINEVTWPDVSDVVDFFTKDVPRYVKAGASYVSDTAKSAVRGLGRAGFGEAESLERASEAARSLRTVIDELSNSVKLTSKSFIELANISTLDRLKKAFPLDSNTVYDSLESNLITRLMNLGLQDLFRGSRLTPNVEGIINEILVMVFKSAFNPGDLTLSDDIERLSKSVDKLTDDEKGQLLDFMRFIDARTTRAVLDKNIDLSGQWVAAFGLSVKADTGIDVVKVQPAGVYSLSYRISPTSAYMLEWPRDKNMIKRYLAPDKFQKLEKALTFDLDQLQTTNNQIFDSILKRIVEPLAQILAKKPAERADDAYHALKVLRTQDIINTYVPMTSAYRRGLDLFKTTADATISKIDPRTPGGLLNLANLLIGNVTYFYAGKLGQATRRVTGLGASLGSGAGRSFNVKVGDYVLGALVGSLAGQAAGAAFKSLFVEEGAETPILDVFMYAFKPGLLFARGVRDQDGGFKALPWGIWAKIYEVVADYKIPALGIEVGKESEAVEVAIKDFTAAFKSLGGVAIDEENVALMSQFNLLSEEKSLDYSKFFDAMTDFLKSFDELGDYPVQDASTRIKASTDNVKQAAADASKNTNLSTNGKKQKIIDELRTKRVENINAVVDALSSISPGPVPVFTNISKAETVLQQNKDISIQDLARTPSKPSAGGDQFMFAYKEWIATATDTERNWLTGLLYFIISSAYGAAESNVLTNANYYMDTCFPESSDKLRQQLKASIAANNAQAAEADAKKCFTSISEAWREVAIATSNVMPQLAPEQPAPE